MPPYEFMPADYGKPCVVAGFEPLDLMQSVLMLIRQLDEGLEVENQYGRAVLWEGNLKALQARGLRTTPILRMARARLHRPVRPEAPPAYADLDAELRYSTPGVRVADPKACQCGEVLKGVLKPPECFGTACTPERPLGALMVSEGACAAYYNFGRKSFERVEIGSR